MKFSNEYRSPELIEKYLTKIKKITQKKWNIMEVCGGQTHAIFRYGIDQLIPPKINLLHGPGCPVCVTPSDMIDKAIMISFKPQTVLCTFGDMIRVPGSHDDLLSAKAKGANIRVVYSPLEAVELAKINHNQAFVFMAIGFETTAPLIASVVLTADKLNLNNFYILNGMVRIPPAIEMLLSNPAGKIDALLAPGHVCTISGYCEYEFISSKYNIPIIITGFEPADLVQGIFMAIDQLENGKAQVVNQYARAVIREGNNNAQLNINRVFDLADRHWRGLGVIKDSGYVLNNKFMQFDAQSHFNISVASSANDSRCIASDILQGFAKPDQCPEFNRNCRPDNPIGPMMVSSEGACSAYYKYRSNYAKR